MFSVNLRRQYEQTDGLADSGSRPVLNAFIDADHRERRFMPRNATRDDLARFDGFSRGIRQVVRRQGRLEPAF